MSNHTKGPWEIFGETNDNLIVGNELNDIAYIPKIHPEAEANARLIASAPEMLGALKIALMALETRKLLIAAFPATNQIEFIKNTIAKATGKTP